LTGRFIDNANPKDEVISKLKTRIQQAEGVEQISSRDKLKVEEVANSLNTTLTLIQSQDHFLMDMESIYSCKRRVLFVILVETSSFLLGGNNSVCVVSSW
jgi:hypothetical protein